MAETYKYLDYQGLSTFADKIKAYVDAKDTLKLDKTTYNDFKSGYDTWKGTVNGILTSFFGNATNTTIEPNLKAIDDAIKVLQGEDTDLADRIKAIEDKGLAAGSTYATKNELAGVKGELEESIQGIEESIEAITGETGLATITQDIADLKTVTGNNLFASVEYKKGDNKICFYAPNDTSKSDPIGEVDTSDFVVDGFLNEVKYNETAHTITFTWNEDSGKTTSTVIDLNKYMNVAELANKADKATTLAGYGITDAYTMTEAKSAFAAKSLETTVSNLSNNVYTKTDADKIFVKQDNIVAHAAIPATGTESIETICAIFNV